MLIEFSYCSSLNEGLPCRNIIGCWEKRTDIIAFLKENFIHEQLIKIFGSLPQTRIGRIIDVIEKRKR